jgi:CHAT domain-containing protein
MRIAVRTCCTVLVASALNACGGAPQEVVTESSSELTLKGSESSVIRRQLPAGTWLVEIRERGIDVTADVQAAGRNGSLRETVRRHGVLYGVVSLEAPGELAVTIRGDDLPASSGGAFVRIARIQRPDGGQPGPSESGYRAWAQACEESAAANKEAWARAADKLNEAILHFESARDDQARGDAAYALASLQNSKRDDWTATIRAAEIASDAYEDSDDEAGVRDAAVVRAAAEIDLASGLDASTQRAEQKSLYDAADRRLVEAAKYFISQTEFSRAAYATNQRGKRALNLGADAEAAGHFASAVDLAQRGKDAGEQVKALMNLAWSHRLQGQVRQAADEYASLLPMMDPNRDAYVYGVALNNYGYCLIALGEFDRALELHTQALQLFTDLGQNSERANQLSALGTLYFRVGDAHRALETLRSAIVELEKSANNRSLVTTLRIAGNAASSIGQHDLALEYLRRSVSIDANPHDMNRTRVLVASELRQIGDLKSADAELEQSLASSNKVVRADALAERARLRLAQRRPGDAIADLRAADLGYRELGLEFGRIDANATLSQLLLTAKDLPGATRAADEAVAIVRRLRVNSANAEWRARFLSAKYAPFEARIAVDLAQPGAVDEGIWQAFRTADEVRARSLADQLVVTQASRKEEAAEIARQRDVLNALQLRLEQRVQNPQADAAVTLELRREIAEIRARLDDLRTRQEPVVESTVRLPASLADVQKKLPADTMVLAYFVGDGQSHAWLLSKHLLRHSVLPGRARLQQAIDATADHPASASARDAERALGATILGKILDGATETKLLVIPDGPLNAVPFAALPTGGTSGTLLVDRFLIGYAPSLALAFAKPSATHAQGTRVAVVSDPVYAPDDQRLPALGSGVNHRGSRQSSPNKLTRLPYSALEARAVRDTFGQKDTQTLSGFDATRQQVLELASQELAVLHFATHAVAREDAPERSALFLSEYSADGSLRPDSQLTTTDIMASGLRARVVVLSGCATGDGNTLRGEGVLGLTYGFLANGSGAVIASLWPVEDASTARLMSEFYKAYRMNGNAAEALRAAQLRAKTSQQTASVWSSFVVRANGFP